jgi:hypothetical protein
LSNGGYAANDYLRFRRKTEAVLSTDNAVISCWFETLEPSLLTEKNLTMPLLCDERLADLQAPY